MRGQTLGDLLPEYFALTGQPAVPPKWSFGLWMSKISYRSREEVERVARRMILKPVRISRSCSSRLKFSAI